MSVVVVVKKDKKIVIAADTLTTHHSYIGINSTHKANSSKIVKYKDNYIGSVGAAVANQMLLSSLMSKNQEFSFYGIDNIYNSMIKIHRILKKDHYLYPHKKDQISETSHLNLLIANSSGIYGISSYRYIADYSKFWAVGSGMTYALGAMEQAYSEYPAEEIAKIGVEAACEFDKHCELPLNIHIIKEDLVKDKLKVVELIVDKKICDNWCNNVSLWIKNIKNYIKKRIDQYGS
jgi:ATP-dependent protease HslVU (ClpYQ) peptidase subunit